MGHLGLTPQSVLAMGGYKVQGRAAEAAAALVEDALAIAEAGVFSIVLEGIPAALAARVTVGGRGADNRDRRRARAATARSWSSTTCSACSRIRSRSSSAATPIFTPRRPRRSAAGPTTSARRRFPSSEESYG